MYYTKLKQINIIMSYNQYKDVIMQTYYLML